MLHEFPIESQPQAIRKTVLRGIISKPLLSTPTTHHIAATMTSLISKQLADGILARPFLKSIFVPFSNWYANAAGHRKLGLRFDDLIEEETDIVQKALKRLSPKESYDRVYRIRRAVQLSYQHKLLPKNEWTKPEEDYPYLGPIIQQIQAEEAERLAFETMEVQKKHH